MAFRLVKGGYANKPLAFLLTNNYLTYETCFSYRIMRFVFDFL